MHASLPARGVTLDEAAALIADWTLSERQTLRDTVPKLALATPFRGGTLRDVAAEVLRLADAGLKARARMDLEGNDERKHLAPLAQAVETGLSPADILLAEYQRDWKGDINRVFDTHAF